MKADTYVYGDNVDNLFSMIKWYNFSKNYKYLEADEMKLLTDDLEMS